MEIAPNKPKRGRDTAIRSSNFHEPGNEPLGLPPAEGFLPGKHEEPGYSFLVKITNHGARVTKVAQPVKSLDISSPATNFSSTNTNATSANPSAEINLRKHDLSRQRLKAVPQEIINLPVPRSFPSTSPGDPQPLPDHGPTLILHPISRSQPRLHIPKWVFA